MKVTVNIGDTEISFMHTAVNLDAHLFIDGTHRPELCPECIQPGTLQFNEEIEEKVNYNHHLKPFEKRK